MQILLHKLFHNRRPLQKEKNTKIYGVFKTNKEVEYCILLNFISKANLKYFNISKISKIFEAGKNKNYKRTRWPASKKQLEGRFGVNDFAASVFDRQWRKLK